MATLWEQLCYRCGRSRLSGESSRHLSRVTTEQGISDAKADDRIRALMGLVSLLPTEDSTAGGIPAYVNACSLPGWFLAYGW